MHIGGLNIINRKRESQEDQCFFCSGCSSNIKFFIVFPSSSMQYVVWYRVRITEMRVFSFINAKSLETLKEVSFFSPASINTLESKFLLPKICTLLLLRSEICT